MASRISANYRWQRQNVGICYKGLQYRKLKCAVVKVSQKRTWSWIGQKFIYVSYLSVLIQVEAIARTPNPKNKQRILSRFLTKLSTTTEPLRRLTYADEDHQFTKKHVEVFHISKKSSRMMLKKQSQCNAMPRILRWEHHCYKMVDR
jgi:hypothetical protein